MDTEPESPKRKVRTCPWCGPATRLARRADGMGGTAVCCQTCGCIGPVAAITGDFDEADEAALDRWGRRPPGNVMLPPGTIERIAATLDLETMLAGTALPRSKAVSIALSDLHAVLSAAGYDIARPAA